VFASVSCDDLDERCSDSETLNAFVVSAARVMNLSQSTSMVCISNKHYNGGNEVSDSSSKALFANEHRQVGGGNHMSFRLFAKKGRGQNDNHVVLQDSRFLIVMTPVNAHDSSNKEAAIETSYA
jgi:vacuolar-type H+-ATPase subunit B/Vma2